MNTPSQTSKMNADLMATKVQIEKALTQKYKPSLWKRFEDFVGVILIAIFILICIIGIVYVLVTLIENPVSLAILCVSIVVLSMWWSK